MPDWSYRTVFRPIFFRLPVPLARGLCLGVVGTLARLPFGGFAIDLLGHMRPDERLGRSVLGLTFPSPVGLGAGIDGKATALRALARFGFGFLDLGPVAATTTAAAEAELLPARTAIRYPDSPSCLGMADLVSRLEAAGPLGMPLLARLVPQAGATPDEATAQCASLVAGLGRHVALFALTTAARAIAENWDGETWRRHVRGVVEAAATTPLLLLVPPDLDTAGERLIEPAVAAGVRGILVAGGVRDGGDRLVGAPEEEATRAQVQRLRALWDRRLAVVASGGVREPAHALALLADGADLVQIDGGLVYGGPGLPKRVNEAILAAAEADAAPPCEDDVAATKRRWFWMALLGAGMTLGSVMALAIAATRVVLPYDEAFVGMTKAQLYNINDRLLAFMTHDRVTLAGTMVTIGVLYTGLACFGVRRGRHWAGAAVFASAFTGFGSFFLFLGFGYFDPFHAFVTGVLLQLLLLALHADPSPPAPLPPPGLREDAAWRRAQWGQLLFVVHHATLIVAGLVIATVGCTQVFVHEDLEFMRTTAEALRSANERLVPLVAHDRATFGGMMMASGVGLLLTALWGFRRGERWLWWTFLAAGLPAYLATLGVHGAVGYTDLFHLAPAFAGLALYAAALLLSYPFLAGSAPTAVEARAAAARARSSPEEGQ